MTYLSDLKNFGDFEVLAMGNDGVEYNGPDRCQPKEIPTRVFADGKVWESCMVWINKGLGTYSLKWTLASIGPEPSQEWYENQCRQSIEDQLASLPKDTETLYLGTSTLRKILSAALEK